MAISNFLLTIVGVGAVAMLMSKDLKQSSAMLRRNMRHVRTWLEEQGAAAEQAAKQDVKQVTERKPPAPGEGSKPDAPKQQ
ncbi:DNA double-strand break repair rad50 ATPase [Micractinium conductrix]|uniref:DNA double-strand break repair rad50 ATPase n=1 Tax=Micractinium conductrix TaxID=554055 RepID=A0A2P6VD89_9CHLO|nr:DNA double-strand break repair rad50 ATPase [Micractinium conductrix]|eukprot:PSC72058.1 DNA double-strand break repair rad50 ATPase [Micractinium conductrix]